MRALKMRSTWPAIRSWQLAERIIEADPFTTTQEVVEELNTGHSMIIQHLKQTGKVKKLNKWVSHELTENQKPSPFKMSSTTMNHFWIRLWHMMKSEFCMITGDNQFSGWTEKKLRSTSQCQTAPKKDYGHCLVVCCSSNSLQLSESQWNHDSWEVCSADRWDAPKTGVCSQHRSTKRAQFFSVTMPDCSHITDASKIEWIGLWSVALSAIITWPLTNWLTNWLQVSRQRFVG